MQPTISVNLPSNQVYSSVGALTRVCLPAEPGVDPGQGKLQARACLLLHNSNNPFYEAGSSISLLFKKDVVVKKFSALPVTPHEIGIKQKIFEFSESSRRRLLFTSRNSGHFVKSQVCLTFHNSCPINGKAFKQILNIFLTRMRKEFENLYYLWVLEFQTKGPSPGQPHAHLFSNLEPDRATREKVAKLWVSTVSGTESNFQFTAHKNNFFPWVMDSGSYLAKEYIAKSIQKDVPAHFHNVGRFWGCSRNMKPTFSVVHPDLFHTREIYTKAIRVAYKLYEQKIGAYMKKEGIYKRLNFRSKHVSRTLPNLASAFMTVVKHFWFYGIGETGAYHQPFDLASCPSFEYGVSF